MVHGLSCSAACGIFPDQGSNPVSPALVGGFLTIVPPGKSFCPFFNQVVCLFLVDIELYELFIYFEY